MSDNDFIDDSRIKTACLLHFTQNESRFPYQEMHLGYPWCHDIRGHDNLLKKYELLSPFNKIKVQANRYANKHTQTSLFLLHIFIRIPYSKGRKQPRAGRERAAGGSERRAGLSLGDPRSRDVLLGRGGGGGILEAAHATVALKSLLCNCPVTSSLYCHVTVISCTAVKSGGTRSDTPKTAPRSKRRKGTRSENDSQRKEKCILERKK